MELHHTNEEAMLKFFRRIRRKLLNEGSFKKYLVYAIGEILLVVIGILIALQVNNWSQKNAHQELELEYLKSMQVELRQDSLNLTHELNRLTYTDSLHNVFLQKIEPPNQAPSDSLLGLYMPIFNLGTFIPQIETFESAKESGHLNIIKSDEIKLKYFDLIKNYDIAEKNYDQRLAFVIRDLVIKSGNYLALNKFEFIDPEYIYSQEIANNIVLSKLHRAGYKACLYRCLERVKDLQVSINLELQKLS